MTRGNFFSCKQGLTQTPTVFNDAIHRRGDTPVLCPSRKQCNELDDCSFQGYVKSRPFRAKTIFPSGSLSTPPDPTPTPTPYLPLPTSFISAIFSFLGQLSPEGVFPRGSMLFERTHFRRRQLGHNLLNFTAQFKQLICEFDGLLYAFALFPPHLGDTRVQA